MSAPFGLEAAGLSPKLPGEFGGFFEHLRAGRIAFPRCRSCGRLHWYPMKRCPHCFSPDLHWSPVEGDTTLYSWTTVKRAFSESFRDKVPYIVALVEFSAAPGIRLITNIVDGDENDLTIDMPVEPVFAGQNDAVPLVFFRPVGRSPE